MADMTKTRSQLLAEFPDNTIRLIHPSDVRDLVMTTFPFLGGGPPGPDNDRIDTAGVGAFFDFGSHWFHLSAGDLYYCQDGQPTAAVWIKINGGGGAAAPLTLTAPTDADFDLALQQHSNAQSADLLKTLDSAGGQFGPRITGGGALSNPSTRTSSGIQNELFGAGVGAGLTTGDQNTFVGYIAGSGITNGHDNVCIGHDTMKGGNGSFNTVVGSQAMILAFGLGGNSNTVVGYAAAGSQLIANNNTAIGPFAGNNSANKSQQTAVGAFCMVGNATGDYCTGLGYIAGHDHPGDRCTFLGAGTDAAADHVLSTAIGYGAIITADHQIVMGTGTEDVHFPGTVSGAVFAGTVQGFVPDASGAGSGTYLDHTGAWTKPTVGAADVTPGTFPAGVLLPAAQLDTGTIPTGVLLPADQLSTGTIPPGIDLPADQLSAGTISPGVDVPWANVSGSPLSAAQTVFATTSAGPAYTTIYTCNGTVGLVGSVRLISQGPGLPANYDWRVTINDPRQGNQTYTGSGVNSNTNTIAFIMNLDTSAESFLGTARINQNTAPITGIQIDVRTAAGSADCSVRLDAAVVKL